MKENTTMFDLQNEVDAATAQALAVAYGFSCVSNLDIIPEQTLSGVFWGLRDQLTNIENLNAKIWEQYSREKKIFAREREDGYKYVPRDQPTKDPQYLHGVELEGEHSSKDYKFKIKDEGRLQIVWISTSQFAPIVIGFAECNEGSVYTLKAKDVARSGKFMDQLSMNDRLAVKHWADVKLSLPETLN